MVFCVEAGGSGIIRSPLSRDGDIMQNQAQLAALQPVLALVAWTLVMWLWMLLTRIPAMVKAKVVLDPKVPPKELTSTLPPSVRWVADNYNHLMEAPTLFYAAAIVVALACPTNGTAVAAAWAYVALRVMHSLLQALVNHIPTRLALFVMSTVALGVVVWQAARAVFEF
jgi:hypothetical protein